MHSAALNPPWPDASAVAHSAVANEPATDSKNLEEECRAIMSHHAKSFRWAALFLSERQRADSAIAYAYCRFVDDSVDEAPNKKAAIAALSRLTREIEGESPATPLFSLYKRLAESAGFGLAPAKDLLNGAASDLGAVRLEDDEELLRYCYQVAGTVGLMMSGILGVRAEQAQKHAIDLGLGMQITNICRDVLEDAERGRVYLPANRLHAAGTSPEELLQFASSRTELSATEVEHLRLGVQIVVSDLLQLAEEKYQSGEDGFSYLPTRARLAITVAAYLYRHIGRTLLQQRDGDPLRGRVSVNWRGKLLLTAQAVSSWSRLALRLRTGGGQ